jgi:hypothetical protein
MGFRFNPGCNCCGECGCQGDAPRQFQVTLGGGFSDGSVEAGYPSEPEPCSCDFLNDASAIAALGPDCTYDFDFGEVLCTDDAAFIFAQGFLVLGDGEILFSLGFLDGDPPFWTWSLTFEEGHAYDCTQTYTLPFTGTSGGDQTICVGTPDAITIAPIF